jgi:hypothetical protein
MSYYRSNAIYDNLGHNPHYCWTSGNAWTLVYGDQHSVPKLLVFAQGSSWAHDPRVLACVNALSRRTGLSVVHIEFDDVVDAIETVRLHHDDGTVETLSLVQLKALFAARGVPVNANNFAKAINSQKSSAYHDWQRASLGRIIVSDIDLVRVQGGNMMTILELKRAFQSLDDWSPYPDDFPNFRLINNLCVSARLNFMIAYNVRHTQPTFFDDPSQIKLFWYDANFSVTQTKIVSFNDFKNANY